MNNLKTSYITNMFLSGILKLGKQFLIYMQ